MKSPVLLVIDDEPLILDVFRIAFPSRNVALVTASTAKEGLKVFTEQRPSAVLLDVRLPDMGGYEVYSRLHEIDPLVPVILMTGHGTAQTAIEAMRIGAFDYLVKPLELDELTDVVTRAFECRRLMSVPAVVTDQEDPADVKDVLIGHCAAMQEVYKSIGRVASQDITVLILGDSGTGKELVARAIYHYSKRSQGRLLAINCAAIPEPLLESELFGHEKGAFTGAERRRIGKFEQCNGGTLFLDEIGDMSPLTQAKILRVLQDGQFERVGGNETVATNVRIIAATNRNLESLIVEGKFRQDLYYRLYDFVIRLPALRDRGGDLDLLATHFMRRASREFHREVTSLSPEAFDVLHSYSWPGNVRELQSIIRQAVVQATSPVLGPALLTTLLRVGKQPDAIQKDSIASKDDFFRTFLQARLSADSTHLYAEVLELVERQLFRVVLEHTHHNLSQAARILGISRPTLRSKLAMLGIMSTESKDH